jgi:hypothetical protein
MMEEELVVDVLSIQNVSLSSSQDVKQSQEKFVGLARWCLQFYKKPWVLQGRGKGSEGDKINKIAR